MRKFRYGNVSSVADLTDRNLRFLIFFVSIFQQLAGVYKLVRANVRNVFVNTHLFLLFHMCQATFLTCHLRMPGQRRTANASAQFDFALCI